VKQLSYALALAGLLLAILLVAYFGFGNVVAALGSVGLAQFGVIIAWQFALFVILGLAWYAIVPPKAGHAPGVFIWGRMVREAATNCLPFSTVGGFVFGARAVTLVGVDWSTATASTVVDVTAEFLAEIAFAGIGLSILLSRVPNSTLVVPIEVGLALALTACLVFVWVQQGAGAIFAKLGSRIAARRFHDAQERLEVLQAELSLIYGHTVRLVLGVTIHLIGWLGAGVNGWIIFHALGVPIDFDDALAIEALLAAASAVAFLVPASAGVQEAGYVGLGAIFGVAPEISLSVSLIRRARDLLVGVPILLLWQMAELRRLRLQPVVEQTTPKDAAPEEFGQV
jgi:putative membrane protein